MQRIYKVITRTGNEPHPFSRYLVVARNAADAIRKATKMFILKTERADEVEYLGNLDAA